MEKYHALDTETINGKAFLLSAVDGVHEIHDFFDFVTALRTFCEGTRKTACFAWFNLDYDATGLFKHLPVDTVRELFVKTRAKWRGVGLEYLPGKYLKVSYRGFTFYHYDVYAFFQMSLDAASAKFLKDMPQKRKVSKRALKSLTWKKYRAKKAYWDKYAIQDAYVLQRLVDELAAGLAAIGHTGRNIYSPGYVAKKFLQRKRVSFGWSAPEYAALAEKAYHGACVEVYQRGYFPHAYSYDLKSAYPAALAELPNFEKASYSFDKEQTCDHYFVKARVWMKEHAFYLLPHVIGGVVRFPRFNGQIAYLSNEEVNCLRFWGDKVEPLEYLNIRVPVDEKPYAAIASELFEKRKAGGMQGLVYKLILNSMYGITAEKRAVYRKLSVWQSVQKSLAEQTYYANQQFVIDQSRHCPSARWWWMKNCSCDICQDTRTIMRRCRAYKGKQLVEMNGALYAVKEFNGVMANTAVAAKITAITRVRMYWLKRCAVTSKNLVACFTDSIKTLAPIGRAYLGSGLGDLAPEIIDEPLTLLGCGVYEHGEIVKLRGFHYKGSLRNLLKRQSNRRVLKVPSTSRLTGLELIHEKGSEFGDLNVIIEDSKSLNINFDSKRIWPRNWKNAGEVLRTNMKSKPLDFGS